MVLFYQPTQKKSKKIFDAEIIDLDTHCNGVAKDENNVWFIPGSMIGDKVKCETIENNKKTNTAKIIKFYKKSQNRISSNCKYSGICGGCSCDFIPQDFQLEAKINGIKQNFQKNGITLPNPDYIKKGNTNQYRRTCRLSTYYERKTNTLHIGFRENNSHNIVDINQCVVLEMELSNILTPLYECINKLDSKAFIGHIEITKANNGIFLLIKNHRAFNEQDQLTLELFLKKYNINGFQLTDDKLMPIFSKHEYAQYQVNNINYNFLPNDFIQINEKINQDMINIALEYLNIKCNDNILDLFCGLGNFTLQIAPFAKSVVGVEVVDEMVKRAQFNASINNQINSSFIKCDLSKNFLNYKFAKQKYDSILLDPGREGALFVPQFLIKNKPSKIVYISCNPTTAIKDFKTIVENDYIIEKWSILDMFPNTSHVETVVLLSRN